MAYQPPHIGPGGLTVPSYPDIVAELLTQFQNVYGTSVYLGVDSADYQWISILALKLNDAFNSVQWAYNNRAPNTATGGGLDGIVTLNGLGRKGASPSTCSVVCTNTSNLDISIFGGVVQDTQLNLWDLPAEVDIPANSYVTVTATCEQLGPVTAAPNTLTTPYAGQTAGWTSVTNPSAANIGSFIETDSQLRARQMLSVRLPSQSMVAGTVAQIWAVPGVSRVNVQENNTNINPDANGLPAHSIACVVEGGDTIAIANAIYNNRSIGCATYGATTVAITDPVNGSITLNISFSRPINVPVYVSISVHPLDNFYSAVLTNMQTAIVNYLNSLEIGEEVVVSEIYGAALTTRPDPTEPMFSIRSCTIGTASNPTGTADITIAWNQVAQGVTANVVITQV